MLAEWARRKLAEAEGEKGFKTQAIRELEALQRSSVYPAAVIRVQLPDRTVLQGAFSPLVRSHGRCASSGGRSIPSIKSAS